MNDDQTLDFVCPHCGGPLHLVGHRDVECKHRHRFTVPQVVLEQARTSSQATWQAVRALRQRAQTQRWAARDPELYRLADADQLAASAAEDDRAADLLQKQAHALDLTLWRMETGDGDDPG
jgi:hypothetical protein